MGNHKCQWGTGSYGVKAGDQQDKGQDPNTYEKICIIVLPKKLKKTGAELCQAQHSLSWLSVG